MHTIFSGNTFGNGQSQNMGPALRHTLAEYCVPGNCDDVDDPDCDKLRLGLTMYPAVDGRRTDCGWNDRASNRVVPAQEDGCDDVGSELQKMQRQDGREYCDQSSRGWDYEPLDDVLRVQREATFQQAYDGGGAASLNGVDDDVLSRWWERANINLVMLERLPQTSDSNDGDRVIKSLEQACTSYDGHGQVFPSMPTFVLGMKHNTADVSLYGGLLAAAGGTAKCCYAEGGCTLGGGDDIEDFCAHIDGKSEQQVRDDIAAGNYSCGGSEKLSVTGAPESQTLPNLECALAAEKCNGAFAPEPPTDFFGIFACIQVRPRDISADKFQVRHCHDDEMNCSILKEGTGLQYIDANKTLYYVEGMNANGTSFCSALGDGDSTIETWDCPDQGKPCDTGRPGRCGVGKISCASGSEECVQSLAPMPEICNGLDDDCNGQVDNLSTSWDEPLFSVYDPDKLGDYDSDGVDRTAIHCLERDVCGCEPGKTLDYGGPGYQAHVMSWKPDICTCGEGMMDGFDQGSGGVTPGPDLSDEPQAGCSTAGSGGLAAKLVALVFGALVLWICRRRQRQGCA